MVEEKPKGGEISLPKTLAGSKDYEKAFIIAFQIGYNTGEGVVKVLTRAYGEKGAREVLKRGLMNHNKTFDRGLSEEDVEKKVDELMKSQK